jgi:hypothetical protein
LKCVGEIGKYRCGVEVDGGKWRKEGNGHGEQDGDWKVDVWSGGRRRQVETGRKWKWRARWRLESRWRWEGKNGYIEILWEEDGGVDGDADREGVGGGEGWEVKGDRHGDGY